MEGISGVEVDLQVELAACGTDGQEKKALAYARKGILLALLSGAIFSMDGLLIEQSKGFAPFDRPGLLLLIPLVCAGLHDFCSVIITTLVNWKQGRIKELGRSMVSRPARAVFIGSLFGSLFGIGGYMAALQLAGPAYVLPITTLYPAVAAVLAVFILKERISPRSWLGLALCIAGAITIGYQVPESQTGTLFYWGLACAALAAVGWATQGVCSTSGMDFIEPSVALNIYYIVSSVIYLGILIPLVSFVVLPDLGGASLLGEFALSKGVFFVMLSGCMGAFSYLFWYKAMNMTGVSRAMALNISYALWGILLSFLFTDTELTRNLIIGAIVIFTGMFLVIGNPREMLNLRSVD